MRIPDSILESVAVIGGSAWALIASATGDTLTFDVTSWATLLRTIAELSPSAILGGVVIVLWRRYTSREDKMTDLQERNVQALQRVADVMNHCAGQTTKEDRR